MVDINKYMEYRNKHPFTKPGSSYEINERKLVLEQVSGEDKNVVDLCCGSGRFTIPLLRLGKRVSATDLSQGSLDLLARNAAGEGLDLSLLSSTCGMAQNIPVTDGWADCVLFIQAFQYIPLDEHVRVLSEVNRCLRSNGKLVISALCYDSLLLKWAHRLFPSRWKRDGIEYGTNGFELPYHRFKRREIPRALQDCGFEIVSIRTVNNFPFNASTKIDLLIARSGLKTFGCQIIIQARKK